MKPLISVIIPVYNDPEGLRDTLNSLVSQELDKSLYEIIVADNGSTDSTNNIAKDFVEKYPGLIKLIMEDKIQSSYAARNKGIVNSKGEIIVFIDADMKTYPDFLKKIYSFMSDEKIKYAGFDIDMELKDKSIAGIYDKITRFKIKKSMEEKKSESTNCIALRREIFNKVGFLDERLISGGDREFGQRVLKSGYKKFFIKDVIVIHPARSNIKGLYKRHFRLGRGLYQLYFYYPDTYFKYKEKLNLKYFIPERPIAFLNKMLKKKEIIDFPAFYIIFFYIIKWTLKIVKFIGYNYEKNLKKKEIFLDRRES
jgi:glycosyltransferase AglI